MGVEGGGGDGGDGDEGVEGGDGGDVVVVDGGEGGIDGGGGRSGRTTFLLTCCPTAPPRRLAAWEKLSWQCSCAPPYTSAALEAAIGTTHNGFSAWSNFTTNEHAT